MLLRDSANSKEMSVWTQPAVTLDGFKFKQVRKRKPAMGKGEKLQPLSMPIALTAPSRIYGCTLHLSHSLDRNIDQMRTTNMAKVGSG